VSASELLTAPVDYVVLAGQRSPGIATVEGAELVRRLHERRAFGVAGATVVDQGAQLCHFSVRLTLLTTEHLDAWDEWKALLVRPAQRSTQGMDIEHPILSDLEVRSVLLEGRSQLTQDETGGWSVVIKFCEYRAPVIALAVPDSSASSSPGNGSPEQRIEAQDREIQALLADQVAP
jgi:hypothetical protein